MQTRIDPGRRGHATGPMGVRVLLLSKAQDGMTAHRLASCGGLVDVEETMDHALSKLCEDQMGYDLFVMDCDGYGGIDGGEHAVSTLIAVEAKMRVMLVSRDFDTPALPLGRRTAVCLPTATEDDQFRQGFDHVLRDRMPFAVM